MLCANKPMKETFKQVSLHGEEVWHPDYKMHVPKGPSPGLLTLHHTQESLGSPRESGSASAPSQTARS